MTRRTFALATLTLGLLAGCGDTPNPALSIGKEAIKTIGKPKTAAPVSAAAIRQALTPEVIAQIGRPIILAELPARGVAAALVQTGENHDVRTYATQEGITMSLRQGMLIATRGLGNDLISADVAGPLQAITSRGAVTKATRLHRYVDGENQTVLRSFHCEYSWPKPTRVIEACYTTDMQIENLYALDSAADIINSRQWINPESGSIHIETIRK